MLKFLKHQTPFFDLFLQHADKSIEACKILISLINADFSGRETKAREISLLENQGDNIVHEVIEAINKTFVTPLDREDIYTLIKKLDDVLDCIDITARKFILFRPAPSKIDVKGLAEILSVSINELRKSIVLIENMKNKCEIMKSCIELNRLENEADSLYRRLLQELFNEEKDPIQIIKMKDIIEILEDANDTCEDVANVIESIVLKNA